VARVTHLPGTLQLTGATNITAALRHHAQRPHRPLQTLKDPLINDLAGALLRWPPRFSVATPEPGGQPFRQYEVVLSC
jgi:hypothetical protein